MRQNVAESNRFPNPSDTSNLRAGVKHIYAYCQRYTLAGYYKHRMHILGEVPVVLLNRSREQIGYNFFW